MTGAVDLSLARAALGESAALWAGADGIALHRRGWSALSRARSVDYNVVFTTGDGDDVEAGVERILGAKVPGVLMVAGPALGEVQRLVGRSWVCIGSTPVMSVELSAIAPASDAREARRLSGVELDDAHALIAEVFEVGAELAAVAIPPGASEARGETVWGAFDEAGRLRSCLALVRIEGIVVVWSMATAADARGHGHGRRALLAALAAARAQGAVSSVLYASVAAEPFYRRLGYSERERWQMWSRPRWVLGRA